jgi:hypothetical protein
MYQDQEKLEIESNSISHKGGKNTGSSMVFTLHALFQDWSV